MVWWFGVGVGRVSESRCLKGIPKSLEIYTRQVQGPPEKLEDHYKTSTGATREARRSPQDKYRGHQRSKKLSTRQVQGPPEKQKDRSTQGKYRGHQRSKKITTRQEKVQGPPEKQEAKHKTSTGAFWLNLGEIGPTSSVKN